MYLPHLSEVKKMSLEELDRLASSLDLHLPGEQWNETATRLYMEGRDEEAFVYQHMVFRSRELKKAAGRGGSSDRRAAVKDGDQV
jgi:hypothetical protein